jgi:phosphoglycolate phosphatase-like HAD superfamily hydrolase
MVLHAILALGIDDVSFVAVVGDTAADMESGRRAGASIVAGVLSGADDRSRLMGAGATVVLEGISELPGLLGCT